MSFNKPFHRNYRPVKESNQNSGYSDWAYIIEKDYSKNPEHYTRAFLIIQQDILNLFQFVEPSDINCKTYSFRIHELLMRTCVEIEANFKAILNENLYTPTFKNGQKAGKLRTEKDWKITDFKIINKTHHLDDYKIELPFWKGKENIRKPFLSWKNNGELSWYQAYNKSKHDRLNSFEEANFTNLIDAYCGLCVLLSSQFRHVDFQPGPNNLEANGYCYFGGGFGIGDYLIVDFPDDFKDEEKYDFDWTKLINETQRFEKFNYNNI